MNEGDGKEMEEMRKESSDPKQTMGFWMSPEIYWSFVGLLQLAPFTWESDAFDLHRHA